MKFVNKLLEHGYTLIVDDMRNMRRTIKNMLRELGLKDVREADDGDTAMSILRNSDDKCNFLLLDWNMPRMPGVEVAREIRSDKKLQEMPILMVTGETYRDQVMQAGELGINGYIIKPFTTNTLSNKILAILEARANPPDYIKLIKAGEALLDKGDYDKAIAVFNESRNLKDGARVLALLGEANEKKGEMEKAVDYYERSNEKNHEYLKAHVLSANLHLKMGNEEAALESLKRANTISPNNADRQANMGTILMKKGDDTDALKALHKAVEQDPALSSNIAEMYLENDKANIAEDFFRKSLGRSASDSHVYNRLGIALRRQGKWKEAVVEYKKAIKIDLRDERLHFNMGKAYMEGGKNEEAKDCFNKALKLNPELQEAKEELIKCG
jgi:tetratricopeptide (TPR) repeat protein